ncbi:Acyl-CoA synthetase (AMP-forming)/AMP-acid ligase II [Roseovarius marisflavi]|uniref:Acyl-CoA synthetase (AMP-forming)/AMP-acid ligase II n=2 Tax=Roseovarius marisflavi TaxID=1054996 RepID=A0A1M6WYP3_9RHOB|nr:Acyl-CoA synthetase (AMP-forming)/AMP-acid ligase II [Roseovarius marisflavi]
MPMPPTATPYHPRAHPPEKTAFIMAATGESVSFGTLERRANQGAWLLRAEGIKPGDHIAILMENRREMLEVCFAADRAGLYYTTISTHLNESEIRYILADCDARILIASDRFVPMLERSAKASPLTCKVFGVGEAPGAFSSWSDDVARQDETPIPDEAQGLDMLYSSGTTGRPKGIKWPLEPALPGRRTMLVDLLTTLFGYGPETRYLCPAPLYHAAPLRHTMVTLKMGGTAVIMDRFEAETSLKLIEQHRVTHSQWVPTMFVRLLKLPQEVRDSYDLSSMQMAVHAAAPCPVDVKRQILDWWGDIVHEYYAGTENNGFTAINSAEWRAHPGSVGAAKLGVIHICDATGRELAPGSEGEVYFENGQQFTYHKDPEKTAACTNAEGWTTLGDIGRLDGDGYLYLTDRKSFVIISGGVNIYPQETEDTLLGHPSVLDAAVIGIPDEDFGEAVHAVVQLMPGHQATDALREELLAHCRANLSAIKCPRSIEFRQELPRSATGKLYKRKLRAEFWD